MRKPTNKPESTRAAHVDIGDIVRDARATAINRVFKEVQADLTVGETLKMFREAWTDATPDRTVTEVLEGADSPKPTGLRAKIRDAIQEVMAITEHELDDMVEKLVPAILTSNEMTEDMDRADALSCTLSQIRGIVEITIDCIEEQDPCAVGTRMADATAALYGVVALAKDHP